MGIRKCLQCGKNIQGRSDKKFCDVYCKSTYNNEVLRNDEVLIRTMNSILRKNRRILKDLNPVGKSSVRKDVLLGGGYRFKYFTHIYKTKQNNIYYFNYDMGIMQSTSEPEKYIIVNWQDYMGTLP